MLKPSETADNDKLNDEAVRESKQLKTAPRGRRRNNNSVKRKRGRPKGSTNKDREVKSALREQIKQVRAEMRSTKLEFKEAIKNEKQLVREARKELKEVQKREQALLKLFELKDKAVASYADRWTADRIQKIQSPPKRRRRRKTTA